MAGIRQWRCHLVGAGAAVGAVAGTVEVQVAGMAGGVEAVGTAEKSLRTAPRTPQRGVPTIDK
jgi:hypothetical protein